MTGHDDDVVVLVNLLVVVPDAAFDFDVDAFLEPGMIAVYFLHVFVSSLSSAAAAFEFALAVHLLVSDFDIVEYDIVVACCMAIAGWSLLGRQQQRR